MLNKEGRQGSWQSDIQLEQPARRAGWCSARLLLFRWQQSAGKLPQATMTLIMSSPLTIVTAMWVHTQSVSCQRQALSTTNFVPGMLAKAKGRERSDEFPLWQNGLPMSGICLCGQGLQRGKEILALSEKQPVGSEACYRGHGAPKLVTQRTND
jgi:hypothetical protein